MLDRLVINVATKLVRNTGQRSMVHLIWLSLISAIFTAAQSNGKVCARDKSRVVAKVVRDRILPGIRSLGLSNLNPNCKFSLERNMYFEQENHKVFESASRWTCDFCGKAFVSEYFLDQHFENRHSDQIVINDAICLADVCDEFRCDILSGAAQPDYWDIALCLEEDMKELYSQCKVLVNECIPPGLTKNETDTLRNYTLESVCSFLSCSKFWNTPHQEEENNQTVLYIILTTMTCFGIVVYNFVFYNYFYSDTEFVYDPTPKTKYKIKKYKRDPKVARGSDYQRQNYTELQQA